MKTRILLADGHQMFREALRCLLQLQSTLDVVGITGDGLQVIPLAHDTAPHIICIDLDIPGMNGLEVTRALRTEMPQVKVVVLAAFAEQHNVVDMLSAGAKAFVTKIESSEELLRAIQAVLSGRTYLSPDVANVVTSALINNHDRTVSEVVLGNRERQVLRLVTTGHTSIQIGKLLLIAASTVEVHRRNIMRKLDRHNVADLTRYVVNNERGERQCTCGKPQFV